MRRFVWACYAAFFLITSIGHAADAALFSGGTRAIMPDPKAPDERLLDVDLRTGNATVFHLASVNAPGDIRVGGCSKSGFLLATTGSMLLACDLQKHKTVTVYAAPSDVQIDDIAYNPADGGVLLICAVQEDEERAEGAPYRSPLLYVPSDPGQAGFVFCRRVPDVRGAGFAVDGTLYFSCRGDVWMGRVEPDEMDVPGRKFVLGGWRFAPVAILETSLGTSASVGAAEVAAGGAKLYVHTYRMGGSGMGDLFTISRPVGGPEAADASPDLPDYSKQIATTFSSLHRIAEYPRPPYLTSSPDGQHVMYVLRRGETETYDINIVDVKSGETRTVELKVSETTVE